MPGPLRRDVPASTTADPDWLGNTVARILLTRRHALRILVLLYRAGRASTSDLIRATRGHPSTVAALVRDLRDARIVYRLRKANGPQPAILELTLRGIELVETPVHRWGRVFRKWHRLP